MRAPWLTLPIILHALLAIVLCFVPLFDVLGYESSLAVALLTAPTAFVIGSGVAGSVRRSRRALPRAWATTLGVLVVPLALLTLNAVRVRNCNYSAGLAFFAALPVMTGLYASTWGVLARTLLPTRPLWRRLFALAILGVPLLMTAWRIYFEPPIFAYDHLWSHFAGSLYDENIALGRKMLWFRFGTFLRIVGLAWLMRVLERSESRAWVAAALLLVLAWTYDSVVGSRVGFDVKRSDIEAELTVTETRPGLVIHLPPGIADNVRAAIADDHLFRLQALTKTFAVELTQPIHSYVYRDVEQKARLMGGQHTQIAKPWLREIHVHGATAPHDVVPHELAHAVSAEFGSPFLHVSTRWLIFINMGLVEGLAEAVTPERGAYDLHTWARALRALGRAPDMRALLGASGFWSQAPSRAYVVAGSFVRYLLGQYGAEPLKKAYAHGDFDGAYGKSLDALAHEWESFIDAMPLSDRERRLAEDQFKTPSIFAKPCAHEIAQLRTSAQHAPGETQVAIYRSICKHLGDATPARFDLAMSLRRAGDLSAFAEESRNLLTRKDLTPGQHAKLLEAQGQIAWQRAAYDEAKAFFDEARTVDPSADNERLQWVRAWALGRPDDQRAHLRRYLDGDTNPTRDALAFERWIRADSADRTLTYLFGRLLMRADDAADALAVLESGPHPFGPIEVERLRLIAEASAKTASAEVAVRAYERYRDATLTSGDRARAEDNIARLRWNKP